MATIDYEKKYKEALEKAHQLCAYPTTKPFTSDLQDIFPELAEAEDERIRKDIIVLIKDWWDRVNKDNISTKEQMIAWLEKQGEQPKKHDVCDNCDQQGSCVSPCPMKLVEKQGEKKPVPKFKVGDVMRTLQEAAYGMTDGVPVIVSIDDEYYHCTNELIAIKDQNDYEYPPMNKKQHFWSEEDESKIRHLIAFLDTNPNSVIYLRPKEEWIDWLKSLRPQSQWKPSDEQLKHLSKAIIKLGTLCNEDGCETILILDELFEQLKKLREE